MTVKSRSKTLFVNEQRLDNKQIEDKSNIVNDIDAIHVQLKSAPSWDDLRKFIPDIVISTWANKSDEYDLTKEQKDCLIYRAMSGKFLPQAMESINLVFSFDGVTSHDLTHILRTRTNTYIVECTGDSKKNVNDISMSDEWESFGLSDEYKELVKKQMDLYVKAVNSGMPIQDARQILPRMIHQFVIARIPFNNVKAMVRQRLDKQIQPPSDWVYAAQMAYETSKVYKPFAVIAEKFFDEQNWYYVQESKTNFASKFFKPLEQNKTEYTESMQTYFDGTPEDVPGRQRAVETVQIYKEKIQRIAEQAKQEYPWIWSEQNMKDFM